MKYDKSQYCNKCEHNYEGCYLQTELILEDHKTDLKDYNKAMDSFNELCHEQILELSLELSGLRSYRAIK